MQTCKRICSYKSNWGWLLLLIITPLYWYIITPIPNDSIKAHLAGALGIGLIVGCLGAIFKISSNQEVKIATIISKSEPKAYYNESVCGEAGKYCEIVYSFILPNGKISESSLYLKNNFAEKINVGESIPIVVSKVLFGYDNNLFQKEAMDNVIEFDNSFLYG